MIFKFRNNKIRTVLFSTVGLLLAGTVIAAAAYLLGDANTDGAVSIKDVTCIQRLLAELEDGVSEAAADIDANGVVNITDATLIQRWLAEMETGYPIGESFDVATEPSQAPQTEPTTQSLTDADGWGREILQP